MEDYFICPHGWLVQCHLESWEESVHLPVAPVKETADWILDHPDSGLV